MKWSELNLSIIIIACKSDLLKVDDAMSLKRARTVQGQLRAIGLVVGAAVVYTSSVADVNITRLRNYIVGKLYPEASSTEGSIEVNKLFC